MPHSSPALCGNARHSPYSGITEATSVPKNDDKNISPLETTSEKEADTQKSDTKDEERKDGDEQEGRKTGEGLKDDTTTEDASPKTMEDSPAQAEAAPDTTPTTTTFSRRKEKSYGAEPSKRSTSTRVQLAAYGNFA
jgi:hypothetical protein